MKSFASLALAVLALTACQAEPSKTSSGTAQGEVLPGSTSDAMLPLDTVKSQAPLAPKVEDKSAGKPGTKPKAPAKPVAQAEPAGEPSAEAPAGEQ